MSYYYSREYQFSYHGLIRIKNRLQLNHLTELEIINYCLKLIESSNDILETKKIKYIKINEKDLYFVVDKSSNLILTLSPIKPEKLLAILENDL